MERVCNDKPAVKNDSIEKMPKAPSIRGALIKFSSAVSSIRKPAA